jgi:hypothetical protein
LNDTAFWGLGSPAADMLTSHGAYTCLEGVAVVLRSNFTGDQQAAADYIREMAQELALLAERASLDAVALTLEEAAEQANAVLCPASLQ